MIMGDEVSKSTSTHRPPFYQRMTLSPTQSVWLLVGLNVLLRCLGLVLMHPPQLFDFEWYYTHAVALVQHEGYKEGPLYTAYWPMGYPYFLSLLFRVIPASVTAGLIVNVLLSVGIVVFVYLLTLRMTSHRNVALFAALGYTVLPSQLMWNSILGSEELFTFLLLLSLFLYHRAEKDETKKASWIFLCFSGLVMGFACDVRPIPEFFPIALLIYERYIQKQSWRKSFTKVVVFTAALFLAVSPLTLRNWVVLHHFIFVSTNGGVVLWQGTHIDGGYFWSWNPTVNPLLLDGNNQILQSKTGTHLFFQHVIHHPFWTFFHGFLKWFYLYWMDNNVVSVTFSVATSAALRSMAPFMNWFSSSIYWLWMMVCILGFTKVSRLLGTQTWKAISLPLVYLIYNTGIFFFFPAWDRFRYPMMPLYAILLGVGILYLVRKAYPIDKRISPESADN
jgi:Dolichyl-phosphate-mannose-protein mannosyltransferase